METKWETETDCRQTEVHIKYRLICTRYPSVVPIYLRHSSEVIKIRLASEVALPLAPNEGIKPGWQKRHHDVYISRSQIATDRSLEPGGVSSASVPASVGRMYGGPRSPQQTTTTWWLWRCGMWHTSNLIMTWFCVVDSLYSWRHWEW